MSNVIVLARRRAWFNVRALVKSGKVIMPKFEPPKPTPPTSDAALVLAYLFSEKSSDRQG